MPLSLFADEIIRLSEKHASTPVMIMAKGVSLREDFFTHLVKALSSRTERSIRIDWCRPMSGPVDLMGNWLARTDIARINRRLAAAMVNPNRTARIELTASIGRPGGVDRDLILGLCSENLELPPWTTSIRLGGSPAKKVA